MTTAAETPETGLAARSRGWLGGLGQRLGQGDIGALPVILGLIVIWAVFQILNPHFLTPLNLTNLVLQIASVGTISVGVVMVLLLGEIDLSIGAVSGLCAGVMAVLNVKRGIPAVPSLVIAIAVGAAIGIFQGGFFARLRIPSFVVTLAGLLVWQGALLLVLGQTGTINVFDPTIDGLTGTFLPVAAGWALAALVLALLLGAELLRRARRRRAGLTVPPVADTAVRLAAVAVLILVVAAVLNADRGVPLALLILLGFVVAINLLTRRTTFGRHVFAVGGNAEAARRAGISVNSIRVVVFGLAGALAACGGILGASRVLSVTQGSGGGDVLLNSIAAAVIGGTSLFGGRGSAWSAVVGALVIGSISNGMDLLALASPTKFIVTGAVLLAAVTIDAVARQTRQAAGRA
jgi:D-xylose transport system permease protein